MAVKERYEDAATKMEKFKGQLDPIAFELLEYEITSVQTNLEICQKLMNMGNKVIFNDPLYLQAVDFTE